MRWFSQLLWLLASLALEAAAKERASAPEIKTTSFEEEIIGLVYFDDSDTILFPDSATGEVWQSRDGGFKWDKLSDVEDAVEVILHPTDRQVAVILSGNEKQYITKDQGKTWDSFTIPALINFMGRPVSFHAADPDRMIVHGIECESIFCTNPVYYTLDGFKKVERLHENVRSCLWAKSTEQFSTGSDDFDKDRILCNINGDFSFFDYDSQIQITDDFFKTEPKQPLLEGDRAVTGIIQIASVTGYLAAAAKSARSDELALYTTTDTIHWNKATFGNHKVRENAYTILESTNYSMQVDVLAQSTPPMGALFTSNSNGTFFIRNNVDGYTNRDENGYVDFEDVANIPGIVLVNVVANAEELEDGKGKKEVKTKISFDDGRTWQPLKLDKKDLHLHSVTEQKNTGRIFSSPAPGIVMGNGNTGKYLKSRKDSDMYVSADAGLTWIDALEGPHLYEMGDSGSILVAIEDKQTDEVSWSIDHGKTWKQARLDDKIQPLALTTTPDSTSLKFVIVARKVKKDSDGAFEIIALDFSNLLVDTCDDDKDFEDWAARVDSDGKPACLMGHTRIFRRRKPDSECFIKQEFKDLVPTLENCKCRDEDYECDFGFVGNATGGDCKPVEALRAPENACKEGDETFKGPSGYRLIPGNTCDQKGGVVKDEPVDRPCGEVSAPPSGSINSTIITSVFKGHQEILQYYYLERCEKCAGDDETIVALADKGVVYVTHDHGKNWKPLPNVQDDIVAVYPHQYFNDQVFFLTKKKRVYYSKNRAQTINYFDTPEPPTQDAAALSFHPKQPDWLIWTGDKGGRTVAEYSKKHGDAWNSLLGSVRKCDFVYSDRRQNQSELVYCEQYVDEKTDGELVLVGSNNWFKDEASPSPLRKNVVSFATMAEYIVVALYDDDKYLKVDASIDGETFADARFPSNFKVEHQTAYTVLESSTHRIFIHVTSNGEEDQEYGTILKSNSNGTDYILAVSNVNRNRRGYVDFEKIQGLEGVAFVNVVANVDAVGRGEEKKLKSLMTLNDGSKWEPVRHTGKGDDATPDCEYDGDKCALHLHGYTERDDSRRGLSSPSATALLIAHGNTGEFLGNKKDADTYMSTDGGSSWAMIRKGRWAYAFGDRGSIIVIVEVQKGVKTVSYTLDEGKKWEEYQFSDDAMDVKYISTVPSDTSMNFILWGYIDDKLSTVNIDFSGLKERSEKCQIEGTRQEADKPDYYSWSPKRYGDDKSCVFGHRTEYYRKQPQNKCFNGAIVPALQSTQESCECTREDFECDYNYERQSDGTCRLVEGEHDMDPKAACFLKPNVTEYYGITGYRRIPQTTCKGGKEFDLTPMSKPCPSYEDEWNRKHGISGAGLFFAIVLPIAAASAFGWYVWRRWDGKFGRIQLGDGAAGSRIGIGGAFERDAPWIKYPVLALSAVVTVIVAIPMVVSTVWRTVSTRFSRGSGRYGSYGGGRPYTSRGSFQRGRGNYSVVDPDEGELLGDESEEEL